MSVFIYVLYYFDMDVIAKINIYYLPFYNTQWLVTCPMHARNLLSSQSAAYLAEIYHWPLKEQYSSE